MRNDEIRRANRKALPKFLLFLIACMTVGGVIGYCSGYASAKGGTEKLAGLMKEAGAFFGAHIAPWVLVAVAVAVPTVCIPIYRSAKKLLGAWDGEDEAVSDTIDRKLSVVIWITSAMLIISYFLIAATYSGGFAIFDDGERSVVFFVGVAAFCMMLVEAVILLQKCVDAAKQMNPEKKASVYDMRFQRKWMDSCDEAEKMMIGKCAFKAYSATNMVCSALSIVLALCALLFGIGWLPSLTVCLVWMVNLSVYFREAMRYSKAGNRIS